MAPSTSVPISTTPFDEIQGAFSPDGRFVAFVSNETSRYEVYVAPFPTGVRRLVSNGGGMVPRWSREGRELLYLSPDRRMMSVTFKGTSSLEARNPVELFALPAGTSWSSYDIAPDGRFLAVVPVQYASEKPLRVIVNWSPR